MLIGSKNIFLYWEQGESNLPLIHRMNIENIKKRLNKSHWNVIVTSLDKTSKYYIENLIDLPNYFFHISDKILDLSTIYGNQSDIIRLRLLEKYGGVYFDTSTILLKDEIENINLYSSLMKNSQASLAAYSNITFTRKKGNGTNYFKDGKDGIELGVLYAKRNSIILSIMNKEIDKYWLWKTKNKNYKEYPPFKKYKLTNVSFLNEYHIHYTIFHFVITRDETLLDSLVTQSMHMKGKENSVVDGPYSISDRFCRDSYGLGSAKPEHLLKAFLEGDLETFNGKITTLTDRIIIFSELDLIVIPGYMRVEIEKYFNSEEDYKKIESVYKCFYRFT
ncbi:MAG TPA: hypothetical protein EYG73_00275 [Arcobacter sp.]|nr:hypothetical protein [Arcobacter sp.]